MILDFEYNKGKLIISEIDENGDIKMKYHDWRRPKQFKECDDNDPDKHTGFKTWDNKPVKLEYTNRPNRFSIYEYIDRLPEEEQKRLHQYQEPKTFFVDIETEILDTGFVEPKDASAQVLTIAIVNKRNIMVLGLKPLDKTQTEKIKNDIETHLEKFDMKIKFTYRSFHREDNPEKKMMEYFFTVMVPKMPVISGWNFIGYDWLFLVSRCRKLGINPGHASYTGRLEKIFGTDYEVPSHRLVIDYMELYKKWDTKIKVKESNSLDWVGKRILNLDESKVAYAGSLQDMYNNDFTKYVFYNAIDTMLVQLIHEKMQYLNIAFSISNLAKIRLCDFAYKNLNTTLVQTEGFLRNRFRDEEGIVFTKSVDEEEPDKISGGWVKNPAKGLQRDVAILDFASLYPTVQREFKIAPENYKGFVTKSDPTKADFDGTITDIDPVNDVICINGAVFKKRDSVTIKFLEEVYNERKRYKKMMGIEKNRVETLTEELSQLMLELKNM